MVNTNFIGVDYGNPLIIDGALPSELIGNLITFDNIVSTFDYSINEQNIKFNVHNLIEYTADYVTTGTGWSIDLRECNFEPLSKFKEYLTELINYNLPEFVGNQIVNSEKDYPFIGILNGMPHAAQHMFCKQITIESLAIKLGVFVKGIIEIDNFVNTVNFNENTLPDDLWEPKMDELILYSDDRIVWAPGLFIIKDSYGNIVRRSNDNVLIQPKFIEHYSKIEKLKIPFIDVSIEEIAEWKKVPKEIIRIV